MADSSGFETTIISRRQWGEPNGDEATSNVLAFMVAWSAHEPERVGEVLLVRDDGRTWLLGRGPLMLDDQHPRLSFIRQRPGENSKTDPLTNPRISRRQLLVRASSTEALEVTNVGSCECLVNEVPSKEAHLTPGDQVALKGQLVLLCVVRPKVMSRLHTYPRDRVPSFGEPDPEGIVGESSIAWGLRDQLAFVGERDRHVLIVGETGVGKELAARTVHNLSARRDRALVSRSAATFPESLIDAELFGNVEGYPNPGMRGRPGLIGAADGATLFLDEIGELARDLQSRLLRVLDERGEYQRLGDSKNRYADIRLIAATNRRIEELRGDLAARLPFRVEMPDLNDRREDIPFIARYLVARASWGDTGLRSRFFEGNEPRISSKLMAALLSYTYDQHVRELERLLWTSVATSPGDSLALTKEVRRQLHAADTSPTGPVEPEREIAPEIVQECLDRHQGVREKVWRELGMKNRHVLKRYMKKHGLRAGTSGSPGSNEES